MGEDASGREARHRIPWRSIALALTLALGAMACMVARHVQTAPHEVPRSAPFPVAFKGADPERFTFFVVGDTQGRFEVLNRVLDDARAEKPLFIMHLGDLAANYSREELLAHRAAVSNCPVPYLTAIGDHDLVRPGLHGDAYAEVFGPTYYRWSYGNTEFAVLDNSAGYMSRRQIAWLRETLRKTPPGRRIFLFAHQPPFDPRRGGRHAMKPVIGGAEALMALAARAHVAAFFSGHIHAFMQTERGGVPYVITGGGGGDARPPFPFPHYLAVTVDGGRVSWELRLVAHRSGPGAFPGLRSP